MEQPTPRVALGLALRGIATSAADISDGLIGDLGHILKASRVGASIATAAALPLLAQRAALAALLPERADDLALECVLAGGDDYELAFAAPPAHREKISALVRALQLPLTMIGRTRAGTAGEIALLDAQGQAMPIGRRGYDHFA